MSSSGSTSLASLYSSYTNDTDTVLLTKLISHPAAASSVYIQEQMVTVINNITRTHNNNNSSVVATGAVEYLLSLLQLASTRHSDTEIYNATRRTVTKAVIGTWNYRVSQKNGDKIFI